MFYLGKLCLAFNFLLCWHSGSELKETTWAVASSTGQTCCVWVPLDTEIHFSLPLLFRNWIVSWFSFFFCSFWETRQKTWPLFPFSSRCLKFLSIYKFWLSQFLWQCSKLHRNKKNKNSFCFPYNSFKCIRPFVTAVVLQVTCQLVSQVLVESKS